MLAVLRHLLGYLGPYKGQVSLLLAGILIDLAYTLAVPSSMEFLIDEAIVKRNHELLVILLGSLIAAVVVASVAAMPGISMPSSLIAFSAAAVRAS